MIRTTHLLILIATVVSSATCNSATPVSTLTPPPSATPEPTQPLPFTPTLPRIVLPTATSIPLPPTTTRTQTHIPTRIPATVTATNIPLLPIVWDSRLDALGVRVEHTPTQGGQPYWRLTRAEFWDEKENQGKHHIFVNVLDEKGARIIGQEISVEWPGEKLVIITENKPPPEYSANFPLDVNHYPPWGTLGAFDVRVAGSPSDKVIGMGLPPQNRLVVYLLTFQRTIGGK